MSYAHAAPHTSKAMYMQPMPTVRMNAMQARMTNPYRFEDSIEAIIP